MNPYSGLVDLFEKKGLLVKQGNRLKYIDSNGEEHLEFRKKWTGDKLNMIMDDFYKISDPTEQEVNSADEEDTQDHIEEPTGNE
jgi:hypothetical protein